MVRTWKDGNVWTDGWWYEKSAAVRIYPYSKQGPSLVTKLLQLPEDYHQSYVLSYSLPNFQHPQNIHKQKPYSLLPYSDSAVRKLLDRLSQKPCTAVFNSNFELNVRGYASEFPSIEFYVNPHLHTKLIALDDGSMIIGSENFGRSGWWELGVVVRDKDLYEKVLEHHIRPLLEDELTFRVHGIDWDKEFPDEFSENLAE